MLKVIMTKGIPASGKTTWAKEFIKNNPNYKRVNKDDIRNMVDLGNWSAANEKLVLQIRDNLIKTFLKNGFNVIVDDTNLANKHFNRIAQLVKGLAIVEINNSFLKTPINECVKRDKDRENPVGEKVIYDMAKQALPDIIPTIKYDPSLPFAVIVDIDGTLALHNQRSPYDYAKCDKDKPNIPVIDLLKLIPYKIILVSGRNEYAKDLTKKWLKDNGIKYNLLLMRKNKDYRHDYIIKKEIYEKHIKGKYNIKFILDDRNQLVAMWRKEGFPVFQVAEGNF